MLKTSTEEIRIWANLRTSSHSLLTLAAVMLVAPASLSSMDADWAVLLQTKLNCWMPD